MCADRLASVLGERRKAPAAKTSSPPMDMAHLLKSSPGAALPKKEPTAPTMRPMFGSLPAIAVLTRGEFTTALPTPRARSKVGAPLTAIRITWVVPSPFRATSAASSEQTDRRAAPNSSRAASPAGSTLACEDRTTRVSEVDWSPSMDMQLKLRSAAPESIRCSSARGTSTSVRMKQSIVAMFGSIMPAPFAMPTIDPPHADARRSLG
mmetsp:Transcript_14633/g.47824  ORF Transcript_14633/g.47824 Transcript_14633/m.47824 type:complete len:208 (-) Transcript_14633:690-1313(-)